jgi:mevalonate kinase
MGVIRDLLGGGGGKSSSGGGGGGLVGMAEDAYKKRQAKRNRAKMDTDIATSEEDRGSKRSSAKRSDDWS